MAFWLVHTGKDGNYEDHMLKNSVIAIGWHDIPNLSEIKDREELKKVYLQAYGREEKPASMRAKIAAIWNFRTEISRGDLVASLLGGKSKIIIGEVVGEYRHEGLEPKVRHTRKVNWLETFSRSSFDADIQNSLGAHLTVSQIRADGAEERVRSMLKNPFSWTRFYSEFADRLIQYKDNRKPLVKEIHRTYKMHGWDSLTDRFKDGPRGPVRDIDPFTVFGLFNRGLTVTNRHDISDKIAKFLGVNTPATYNFTAIPKLFNKAYWVMPFADKRAPGHIAALWRVFADALAFANGENDSSQDMLVESLDSAIDYGSPIKKLTIGLYWIRPYTFLPLDSRTRKFIEENMGISIPEEISAEEYLDLLEKIRTRMHEEATVRSFPQLSHAAYHGSAGTNGGGGNDGANGSSSVESGPTNQAYAIKNIVDDGCFVEESELESVMEMLRDKKNIILQGPPGTGKTYLAKRLAYALVGSKSTERVRAFQFHPNLSYEDFVRGWRPSGDDSGNRLDLVDGPFLKMIEDAKKDLEGKFVMVIEEINRGNPANIFGEMLTLLEADKRTPEEELTLSYMRERDKPVHVPKNLYVIGTMNVADRSIALVDLALRRRFGFYDLEPAFGQAWKDWVCRKCAIDAKFLDEIKKRLESLNKTIEEDVLLGPHFRIGHSYVTPNGKISNPEKWFRRVVKNEIGPTLDEYWVEEPERAREAKDMLLQEFDS